MKISKQVTVSEKVTSIELAKAFSDANQVEQREFLTAVADDFLSWKPKSSREVQILGIAEEFAECENGEALRVTEWLDDLSKAIKDKLEGR